MGVHLLVYCALSSQIKMEFNDCLAFDEISNGDMDLKNAEIGIIFMLPGHRFDQLD